MKINTFEDLDIWKKSNNLIREIYKITLMPEFKRDYALKDQIRRATISVNFNIAEGFERNNNKEFIRFLLIAKGSAGEVRSQIYIAYMLGYIDKSNFEKIKNQLIEISSKIRALINYLKQRLTK